MTRSIERAPHRVHRSHLRLRAAAIIVGLAALPAVAFASQHDLPEDIYKTQIGSASEQRVLAAPGGKDTLTFGVSSSWWQDAPVAYEIHAKAAAEMGQGSVKGRVELLDARGQVLDTAEGPLNASPGNAGALTLVAEAHDHDDVKRVRVTYEHVTGGTVTVSDTVVYGLSSHYPFTTRDIYDN